VTVDIGTTETVTNEESLQGCQRIPRSRLSGFRRYRAPPTVTTVVDDFRQFGARPQSVRYSPQL